MSCVLKFGPLSQFRLQLTDNCFHDNISIHSRNETCNLFTADSIDASSYTHIVFSFASISASGTLEPWDFETDVEGGQYDQFVAVKNKYPGTKAMIAVGGWTHNDPDNERLYRFSNSASTDTARMKFAQSSVGEEQIIHVIPEIMSCKLTSL